MSIDISNKFRNVSGYCSEISSSIQKKARVYQEDLRQRVGCGPPMESPIHDDGFEVRSVVDIEGSDQPESERESENESVV